MKRLFLMSLCALILMTGCLPTPEVEIVPNKGEQKAWQVEAQPYVPEEPTEMAISEESSQSTETTAEPETHFSPLYEVLCACPTWSTENNDYGFRITAQDCPILLPELTAVPIVEAEQRSFTQKDIDAVAAAMFPTDTVWYPEVLWTKEDMAAKMQELMDEMANRDPEEDKKWHHNDQYYADKLAMFKARYDEAPYAADVVPCTLEIHDCQNDYRSDAKKSKLYPGVKVETRVDGEHWTLNARTDINDPYGVSLVASRCDGYMDQQQPLDAPYGVKMTRAEAIEKATAFVQTITGGNEYSVCYCAPVMARPTQQAGEGEAPIATLPDRWSQWGLVLMRTFNGCLSAFAHEEVGGNMDSTVSRPIRYERMVIRMDDEGVNYFEWNTPMEVTGVVSTNAKVIPFDEAAKRAMSQIADRWKYTVENDRKNGKELTVYINRVTFGLWRIAKKNGGFYYVPVYHFFSDGNKTGWADYVDDDPRSGTADALGLSRNTTNRERFLRALEKEEFYYMLSGLCPEFGGEYWGSVTVNALDGTIIDKDKGY